ncbi:69_t:CDS:2, partial [Acaulospora morrowiae]
LGRLQSIKLWKINSVVANYVRKHYDVFPQTTKDFIAFIDLQNMTMIFFFALRKLTKASIA